MLHPHTHLLLSGLVPFISARPFLETRQAGGIVGVATFNDYAHQSGGEVCSNAGINTTADNQGIYKAAAGDISPDLSSGLCDGSNADPNFQYDMSKCTSDGGVVGGYPHPGCQNVQGSCGKCYSVSNFGAYPTDTGAQIGKTIVVQIVDACPAGSALNYCKVKENPPIPADERCGAGNSLDIDYSAYKDLTGTDYTSSDKANLKIHIQNVPCGSTQGGGTQGGSTKGGAGASQQGGSTQGGSTQGGSIQGSGSSQGSNAQSSSSTQGAGSSQGSGSVLTQGPTHPQSGNLSTSYANPNPRSSYQAQQQSTTTSPNTEAGYSNPEGSAQNTQQQGTQNTAIGIGGAGNNNLRLPTTGSGNAGPGTGDRNPSQALPGGLPPLAGLLGSPPGVQQGAGAGGLGRLFGVGGIL